MSASAVEDSEKVREPPSFGGFLSLARLRRCSSQWRWSIFRRTWAADAEAGRQQWLLPAFVAPRGFQQRRDLSHHDPAATAEKRVWR